MQLQGVLLLETVYPCWAYALARIGKSDLFTWKWINEEMPDLLKKFDYYPNDLSNLKVGDLLVWKNTDKNTAGVFYSPVSITQYGHITWEKINYKSHVCVWEGNGFVSDMLKTDGNFDLPFIIRRRMLEDLSIPNYMIRL